MDSTTGKRFLTGEEFLATPQKQRQWLIKPILPAKGIINLYGKPKTGKSQASLGMGLAIANGEKSWNGFEVHTQGKVAFLQIDTPEGEMWDRLKAVKEGGYNLQNVLVADMTIAPYPFNILMPQHHQWLKLQLEEFKPEVVFIDTLREAHEEDENDSKAMKRVVNTLVHICRPAAIGLISHSRKDSAYEAAGAEADIMDGGRGSSYVSGRMDTVIRFTGKPQEGKGNMHYVGRSKGANGKLPLTMDHETGLVHITGEFAKQEQAAMAITREHGDWSVNRRAKALVEAGIFKSVSTATRKLKKLTGEVEDEGEADISAA